MYDAVKELQMHSLRIVNGFSFFSGFSFEAACTEQQQKWIDGQEYNYHAQYSLCAFSNSLIEF